ncbi:hypothetical protein NEA10_04725 [Phormidium yuhuli AB48]|uniref:Uncharacterized protein n=1 Tax=Phormidium yuhuli AB48 TaxID=2940671 RepID=A0ABY5AT86_9CYAN|nr:hypothetical protein [Phormidium yuhuli]USR92032.1 hypothetical protein NEA10_04725 [Phormidium yuhuli AB48]
MMSKQVTHLRISPQELSDWSQGIFAQHQQELKQLASQEKLPTNLLVAWWMLLFFLIPEIHNIVIDIFPDILDVNFVLVGVAYIALGLTPLGFIKHQLIKSSQIERDRLQLKFQETYPGLSLLANKVKDHNQIIDEFTRLQESLGTRASVEAGQTELRQGLDISKVNFRRAFEQEKQWREGSHSAANSIQLDLATLERLQQQTPSGRCRDLLQQIQNLAVNLQRELNQVLH